AASHNSVASFEDQLMACLESGASVFSFTFGLLPSRAVTEIGKRKMLLMGTATTVEEAKILAELGVDAVVAQGSEAGGHRGTFSGDFTAGMIGTISLVPQICDAIAIPVVASGGIMDGRGIAAALALGASAVQLGTAFLACNEAGIADAYKEALVSSREDQTRLTRAFSGRLARGIANRFLTGMESREDTILPFPLQNALTRPLRAEATRRNRAEYLSLWAGQGLRLARRTSAAELVERLRTETEAAVAALCSRS
ncbi:MAG: nitronate monooxygenase, partial [Acidobacteriota bacterium]|nr:nitronate monooxygenase [Acidobacteriota bacterium]